MMATPAEGLAPRATWDRGLTELSHVLRVEAWAAEGRWTFRMLPTGLLVAVRVIQDDRKYFRRQLRLARAGPIPVPEWEEEVRCTLATLGCGEWCPVGPLGGTGHEAVVVERFPGETEIGWTTCRCGKRIPWSALYVPPRCDACALAAGRAESPQRTLFSSGADA